jgi:hypothetical protein
MIAVSADNVKIYGLLEAKALLPLNFHQGQVIDFDEDEDYCLVVFSSVNRNFILFRAENYLEKADTLVELSELLQENRMPGFSRDLMEKAARRVEEKLHSKNNSRFFFDAH